MLIEGEKVASIGGRPATVLRLNPNYGVFGGVHFNRNEYAVGICDFSGVIKKEKKGLVNPHEAESTLKNIQKDLRSLSR